MECKVVMLPDPAESDLRFNRNIVECKVMSHFKMSKINKVLIETLWNVKRIASMIGSATPEGFNRNIVECKDF